MSSVLTKGTSADQAYQKYRTMKMQCDFRLRKLMVKASDINRSYVCKNLRHEQLKL